MQIRSFVLAIAVLGLTACISGGVPGANQPAQNPNEWTPVHPPDYNPMAPTEEDRRKALAEAKAEEKRKKEEADEKAAKEAEIAAEKDKAAKAKQKEQEAHDQAVLDEQPNVKMAMKVCGQDPKSCKKGCDKDADSMMCFGYGWTLAYDMPPKFSDSKAAFTKSCQSGSVTACDWIEIVSNMEKDYAAEVESLWADVRDAANSIAEKRYLYTFATTKLPQTPKNVKAAANVQVHIKGIIAEQFCPAKKKFVLKVGAVEYGARAKDHCKNDPPLGTGLGGAQVTLTTECNGAFATACS